MPSCKAGHVYIVFTALTKPPKEKFALCVSQENEWFLWFNTLARPHGRDQMGVMAGCHQLIVHDSFLDLSRVVHHSAIELEAGKEFGCISAELAASIAAFIEHGIELMPQRHIDIVRASMTALKVDGLPPAEA